MRGVQAPYAAATTGVSSALVIASRYASRPEPALMRLLN